MVELKKTWTDVDKLLKYYFKVNKQAQFYILFPRERVKEQDMPGMDMGMDMDMPKIDVGADDIKVNERLFG